MHINIHLEKKDYTTLMLQSGKKGYRKLIYLYGGILIWLIFFGLSENAGLLAGEGLFYAVLYVTIGTALAFLFLRFVVPRIMALWVYIREKTICGNAFDYEFDDKAYTRKFRDQAQVFPYEKVARYWLKDDAYYIASASRVVDIFPRRLLDEGQEAYMYNLFKRECAKIDKENVSKKKQTFFEKLRKPR